MPLEFSSNEIVFCEPTARQMQAIYRPYALELGKLLYAWNHLHEQLAVLFWQVIGVKNGSIAIGIWHSTPSDLGQRKMLRAATENQFSLDKSKRKDIIWLLDKIDGALSRSRNDAIHAPLSFFTDATGTRIEPLHFMNNPRAEGLKGKDLFNELVWYRQRSEAFQRYARMIAEAIQNPMKNSWPERPTLPALSNVKNAKSKPRVGRGRARRLRLQASPAKVRS